MVLKFCSCISIFTDFTMYGFMLQAENGNYLIEREHLLNVSSIEDGLWIK